MYQLLSSFCPTKQAFSEAFSLLREALEQRGLSLSSEWFMSDFVHQFPTASVNAIITKVQKSGFKADYARKENIAFRSFSRAIDPLERFKEK